MIGGTWYDAKVVVDNDPNDANLQQLRFWVDANGNGYGDDPCLITSTAVDDVWSAGYVGLYRAGGGSAVQQYDDVKIGYDNDSDGDILDAGDEIQVADNFNSSVMSLTYDNNGNLTDDGVLRYVYDGWNRLRKANRYADSDTTTIATYSYLPDNRRASKVVQHCGIEAVANDGGDTTVHFYYGGVPGASGGVARWNVFETRNGSNQSTRQWVWGTQYVDEVLLMDVNGDPASSNICDVDDPNHPAGSRRYFYHQDRNWNVVALTEYDDGTGVNGRIAERYTYTPYGEFVVSKGDSGSGELGRTLLASNSGNVFFHQGLLFDQENCAYQNRRRGMAALTQRFTRRDPIERRDDTNLYVYEQGTPLARNDPGGDISCGPGGCWDYFNVMHPQRQCCRQTGSCTLNGCPASDHWCEWDSDGCHKPNPNDPDGPMLPCPCSDGGAIHHNAGDSVDVHTDSHGCAFGTGLLGECLWDPICVCSHFWHDVLHLP